MADPIIIGTEIKQPYGQDNAKAIGLTMASTAASSLSMHNMTGFIDYLVPVGKKFIITSIYMGYGVLNSFHKVQVYYNTVTDSTVGATKFFECGLQTATTTSEPIYPNVPMYAEIPAGNYIILDQIENGICVIRGIEIDA